MSLRVVTVATSAEDPWEWGTGIQLLRDSCRRCGHDLEVYGLGEEWTGFGMKLRLMYEAIKDDPAERVVLFVDAYDVLFLPAGTEILTRFLAFGAPIVFSAELACWPFEDLAGEYPEPAVTDLEPVDPRIAALRPKPPLAVPLKYLNSGSYIGYAGAVRDALLELSPEDEDDDQGLFTRYFLDHPEKVSLDYQASLFHTLFGVGAERFVLESNPLGLRSKITGSHPCLVHGNGSGKYALLEIIKGLRERNWP